MALRYDISNYLASIKMSSKKRVLVEGRDDKSHVSNLLDVVLDGHNIKVDTAENIKGDCNETAKNNKAKINKIHHIARLSNNHKNLFYLCDREFVKFDINKKITDLMSNHETDGNLSWTIGHSFENYFITTDLVCEAYRFLCNSEYKSKAEDLYKSVFKSAIQVIAAITLTAKEIGKCTYPHGTIKWQDFIISENRVNIDIDVWIISNNNSLGAKFHKEFKFFYPIANVSDDFICSRVCRGHTAVIMLQRIFSACLYQVISHDDEDLAQKVAAKFSRIGEDMISSSLAEAWIQSVKKGSTAYPKNLVDLVA